MQIKYTVKNQLNYAIYLPAIQTQYAKAVIKTKFNGKLPKGIHIPDLNFLQQNSKLFTLDAALYSAGLISNHSTPSPCMVTMRPRIGHYAPLILGDSGGYQIARGRLYVTKVKREEIYHWLVTYCDLAMTLDVPSFAITEHPQKKYPTIADCLNESLDHLDAFMEMGAKDHKFLNVLQGDGIADSEFWYEHVKEYDLFGWAFAGSHRRNWREVLWRILRLIEDGKFERNETWVHFLGVSDMRSSVMFTHLLRVLRHKFPDCELNISFDTSNPFLQGGRYATAIGQPKISYKDLSWPNKKVDGDWALKPGKFPFCGSKISRNLRKEDIATFKFPHNAEILDAGYIMLQNHNAEVLVSSVDAVHQILDSGLEDMQLRQYMPYHLLDARRAIEAVLLQPTIEKSWEKLFDPAVAKILDNWKRKVG